MVCGHYNRITCYSNVVPVYCYTVVPLYYNILVLTLLTCDIVLYWIVVGAVALVLLPPLFTYRLFDLPVDYHYHLVVCLVVCICRTRPRSVVTHLPPPPVVVNALLTFVVQRCYDYCYMTDWIDVHLLHCSNPWVDYYLYCCYLLLWCIVIYLVISTQRTFIPFITTLVVRSPFIVIVLFHCPIVLLFGIPIDLYAFGYPLYCCGGDHLILLLFSLHITFIVVLIYVVVVCSIVYSDVLRYCYCYCHCVHCWCSRILVLPHLLLLLLFYCYLLSVVLTR